MGRRCHFYTTVNAFGFGRPGLFLVSPVQFFTGQATRVHGPAHPAARLTIVDSKIGANEHLDTWVLQPQFRTIHYRTYYQSWSTTAFRSYKSFNYLHLWNYPAPWYCYTQNSHCRQHSLRNIPMQHILCTQHSDTIEVFCSSPAF